MKIKIKKKEKKKMKIIFCLQTQKTHTIDTFLIRINTGVSHFTALCFIVLCRCCGFYKPKVCGNPALGKSVGAIFQHLFTLYHILVIPVKLKIFPLLLLCLLLWSMVSDLWCYSGNCFRVPQPCKAASLVNVVCVLTAPPIGCCCLSPSFWASVFLETQWYSN